MSQNTNVELVELGIHLEFIWNLRRSSSHYKKKKKPPLIDEEFKLKRLLSDEG